MRLVAKIALMLVVLAAAFEIVLQVAAFAVSVRFSRSPRIADGAPVSIVCLGDSYTYGIGASNTDHSYPGTLEGALRRAGVVARVRNCGWPGQNSRDVLLKMDGWVTDETDIVCILIGTNDGWSRPERLDVSQSDLEADHGFVWRWRTRRLFDLWFHTRSRDWSETGPETDEVSPTADELETVEARWAEGFALLSDAGLPIDPGMKPIYTPQAAKALREALGRAMDELSAGNHVGAAEILEQLEQSNPESPHVLSALVTATVRLRRNDVVSNTLEALRRLDSNVGSPSTTECLLRALVSAGQTTEVMDRARPWVAEHPRSIVGWDVLQAAAFELGDWEEFRSSAPMTMRLVGHSNPTRTGSLVRRLGRVIHEDEPFRAAQLIVGATLLDESFGQTRLELIKVRGSVTREHVDRALASTNIDSAFSEDIQSIVAEVYDGESSTEWTDVLSDHLVRIGRRSQVHGARVVLLSYPFSQPPVEDAQRAAVDELGGAFVGIRERFDRELANRPREDLFVKDGHCNDAGYAIIAEMVSARVEEMLGR